MSMTAERLAAIKVGDKVVIFAGWIPWSAVVTKVTAKLIYTRNTRFRRSTGIAIQRRLEPWRIVDIEL